MKTTDQLRKELADTKMILDTVIRHSDGMDAELLDRITAGENLFEIVSDTIPMPIIISERTSGGAILFVNENASGIFGYSPAHFYSLNGENLYRDPPDYEKLVHTVAARGKVTDFETDMVKSDGTEFPVALFSSELRFRDKPGLFVAIFDLTERKNIERAKLQAEKNLRKTEVGRLKKQMSDLKKQILADGPQNIRHFKEIITGSNQMLTVFKYAERIAASRFPVLLTGETGSGKELMARSIHMASDLKGKLVTMNVAAYADEHFSDAIFGHVRGAFTGADSGRPGLIEKAAGGTLFLDEIGDLSLASQVKLLRLLEEKEYSPLGYDGAKKSDARIIAATNRNLWKHCDEGKFREDLIFRLETYHIHIPPLRERTGDIPLLVNHFICQYVKETGKRAFEINEKTINLLKSHPFPGNVRELRNIVLRAASSHECGDVTIDTFKSLIKNNRLANYDDFSVFETLPSLRSATDMLYQEALKRAHGNRSEAARMLGITPQAVCKWMKKRR